MKLVIKKFISETKTDKDWDIITYDIHPRDVIQLVEENNDYETIYPKEGK